MCKSEYINNDSIFEKIYLLLLTIYVYIGVTNNSLLIGSDVFIDQNIMYNIELKLFSPILIVMYLLNNINPKKELIKKIIALTICAVLAYASWGYTLVTLVCFMFSATCTKSAKKIAGAMFIGLFIGTFVVFYFCQKGVIYDITIDRFGRIGHYFGFYWNTFLPTNLLFSWIMSVYARNKKISWFEIIAAVLASCLIYYYCINRLCFGLSLIAMILYIVVVKLELIKIDSRFVRSLSLAGFSMSAVITFVMSIFYNPENPVLNKLNSMLSGRLILGKTAFERYSVNLLGNDIILHEGGEYFLIDSGFIQILLDNGIIIFIAVMAIYTFMYWYSCKKDDKMLFVWITVQMIYTIINNVWMDLEAGTCLPLFMILYRQFLCEKEQMVKKDKL